MPLTSTSGSSSQGFGFLKTFHKIIADSFSRSATQGGLGSSTNGATWNSITGSWYVNASNQAQSDTSESLYPISAVDINSFNQTAKAVVSEGTGVAVWVSALGTSWYAATSYNVNNSYSCNPYSCNCATCCQTCNVSCNCVTTPCTQSCVTAPQTCSGGGTVCSGGACNCTGYGEKGSTYCCGTTPLVCNTVPPTCTGGGTTCTCTGGGTACDTCAVACNCVACNCSTCYQNCGSIAYYMRILQNLSGVISSVTNDVSLSSGAVAIQMQANADSGSISATAYSDTGFSTVLGTSTFSPIIDLKSQYAGIVKAPTANSQGSTVTNFQAQV